MEVIYNNRELSWLAFNERVLQEAMDPSVPLVERFRFLGIFSNNRDEFFRVRVATVKRLMKVDKKVLRITGESPKEILDKIQKRVIKQERTFENIYTQLLKELENNNIFFINEKQILPEQENFIREYFRNEVMPALAPIMLDSAPSFPYLKDKSIYLIIKMKEAQRRKPKYALLEIPSDRLSRFLVLPKKREENTYIILLDDVIRFCLKDLFPFIPFDGIEAYTIKLTRDAELDFDQDISQSLVEKISKSLKRRKRGSPVRLVYDAEIAPDILLYVSRKLNITKEDNPIAGGRYHNFKDFIDFPKVGTKDLRYALPKPLRHWSHGIHESIFDVLKKQDMLLSYPYQTFYHIVDCLREASIDPKVKAIKITLYRVAKNSNVMNALINAIKNGKQVTVVLELQARFDEENNIYWANQLEEEGAKVIYGVPGLKVHSKLFLISRQEKKKLANYVHIGTGNFNESTARIYSDNSLLTHDRRITEEVLKTFKFYENNLKKEKYKNLLVAPFFMRKGLEKLINTEIQNAKEGKPAEIFIKLNNLADEEMISKLYEANNAGVRIRLIIRGICVLIPGVKGMSENIQVISIVDKFLEHSRVLIFYNGGDEKYFISSADWMSRNLDRRSEVAVPIYDKLIQRELRTMLDLQWADNTKARIINRKQGNRYKKQRADEVILKAQEELYKYYKQSSNTTDLRSN